MPLTDARRSRACSPRRRRVTGAGAYGVGYERHRIGVTERDAAGRRACRRRSTAFASASSPTSTTAASCPPTTSRSAVQLVDGAAARSRSCSAATTSRFGDRAFVEPVAELLAPLHAPHGVFAILGNHDDDRDMPAALTRQRHRRCCRTRARASRSAANGSSWPASASGRGGRPTSRACCAARARSGAAARARSAPADRSRGARRAGGAVGPYARRTGRASRRRRDRARASFPSSPGSAREDNTSIFVSRGIGTVYVPVRINCPPEVAIVTLKRRRSQI